MDKPSFDPGFTEKYHGELHRVITSGGQFNVRRRGTTWRDVHPYLFMINTSWPVFAVMILAGYLIANVVFAFVYMKIGVEHLPGADTSTALTANAKLRNVELIIALLRQQAVRISSPSPRHRAPAFPA